MKLLLLLTTFSLILQAAIAARIVCYYSSWATYYDDDGPGAVNPDDLDANMCTHMNYAFIDINEDGSLRIEDEYADLDRGGYENLVGLKNQNANLKVLLSIGGAGVSPWTFGEIAADSGKRANMVSSARDLMETYGFDGIDMDWEVPQGADRDNFIQLLQDFKDDFASDGWLVTAALSSSPHDGYDVPRLNEVLDFLNIMTYDLYGPWSEYTGQNSALFASDVESNWEKQNLNVAACIDNWLNAGADPEKLVIGLAFYGHSFILDNPSNNGVHAPYNSPGEPGPYTEESGSLAYVEYCENGGAYDCRWDDQQKMPICLNGNEWLGIDNEQSILEKVNYIKSKGLGGAMIWSIDQDDVHGSCGEQNILLRTIYENL